MFSKYKKRFLPLFLLFFSLFFPILSVQAADSLTVHFLDVGQGLSVLLQSNGHYALYDGGDKDHSSRVVSYLQDAGVSSLDYVISSHYDSDHLNGLVGALYAFPVEQVLGPDYTRDTSVYQSFVNAVSSQGLSVTHPDVGSTWKLGSSTFTVLAPNSSSYNKSNDYSIVLKVSLGSDSFLLMGDAESTSEEEILNNGLDVSCDVLCVGHHGSASSTTWDLLEQALPEWAVISCGVSNDYGHPHSETMEKLESMEISVFRTDLQGDITAFTDGNGIYWNTDPCNDYSSGDSTSFSECDNASRENTEVSQAVSAGTDYVVNTNSGKFHVPSCRYADEIKDSNRLDYTGSRDELISQGYIPCKVCNP